MLHFRGILDAQIGVNLLMSSFSHLDDDVEIHMKPGDVCVQRGTIHGWTNSTDKPARVYFILSGKN